MLDKNNKALNLCEISLYSTISLMRKQQLTTEIKHVNLKDIIDF